MWSKYAEITGEKQEDHLSEIQQLNALIGDYHQPAIDEDKQSWRTTSYHDLTIYNFYASHTRRSFLCVYYNIHKVF